MKLKSHSIKSNTLLLLCCFCTSSILALNVKTETFFSPSVQLNLKYTVILPANYAKKKDKKYAVVYLLHGFTGDHQSWIGIVHFNKKFATKYNCILVIPDAGNTWFVNWTGQTDGKPHQWADMITIDLRKDLETKYRTLNTKEHRAIGGFSMGGFGALSIGLNNPDLFGFVFSSSGAVNFCQNIKSNFGNRDGYGNNTDKWKGDDKTVDCKGFSNYAERTPKGRVCKTTDDVDKADPYWLLDQLDPDTMPYVHIDCGTEDYFTKDNDQFVAKLKALTPNYNYYTTKGIHDGKYTKKVIGNTFKIMSKQGVF